MYVCICLVQLVWFALVSSFSKPLFSTNNLILVISDFFASFAMSDDDSLSDSSLSDSEFESSSSDDSESEEEESEDDIRNDLLPEEFQDPEAKLSISGWGVSKLRRLFLGQPISKEDRQKLTVHIDFCFSLRCLVIYSSLGKILLFAPAISAFSTSEIRLITFVPSQVWRLECFS